MMADQACNWCTDGILGLLVEVGVALTVKQVAARRDMSPKRAQMCLDILRQRGLARRVTGELADVVIEQAGERRKDGLPRTANGVYGVTDAGRSAWRAGRKIRSGPCRPHNGRRTPIAGTLQARLWKGLRQLKKATVPELLTMVAHDADRDPAGNARKYLRVLAAAGYVAAMKTREPGTAPTSNGFKRFLLINDTGPAAPVWNPRKKTLRDGNTKVVIEVHFGRDRP
jgi:hypothetical protein